MDYHAQQYRIAHFSQLKNWLAELEKTVKDGNAVPGAEHHIRLIKNEMRLRAWKVVVRTETGDKELDRFRGSTQAWNYLYSIGKHVRVGTDQGVARVDFVRASEREG